MAAVTAAMVKELRESTGAGMMECKKALTETMVIWKQLLMFLERAEQLRLRRRQEELQQKVLQELHLKAIQQL